ncbi:MULTISPECIES: cell division protein ZapA [unclassified Paracoccus (in: a-proteobacteria)]|uniref:cell division protein ZapA n=1 Tax=unclassified Paracoccus (in: a-proteobacteria) TaxID=2688777 RepID=UPI0012B1FCE3|nr:MULTISPECIES: cell division protein ZapA [unclassified Paracoccus (in: a-proteobacteria)]UXU74008.1 cell division protein ZapA [Paracoccus sp. SMMA_5]UXU79896.1 cell division protein ZapA [Paracoccus sp. SMMA_5_TC]
MAVVEFSIGHKSYSLSCQDGEERLLKRAAGLLDAEARVILEQAGRMPEARLLLLAALMLADRTAGIEDRLASTERELARLKANPPRVEVPVVPASLSEAMAELAARAEALAQKAEDQIPRD